jgi:hypothetical protein
MVQQIFAFYLEPQATLYQVAARLTATRPLTLSGKERWTTATIRNILRAFWRMGGCNRPLRARDRAFLTHVSAARLRQLNGNPFGGCNPVADPLV